MSDDNSMFDKIVEFGMGMTIARQIPQMMDMVTQKQTQQSTTPPEIKSEISNVYIANNGQQAGPFCEMEIKQLISNGVLNSSTMVWMPQMPQWALANQVPAINKLFLLASSPSQNAGNSITTASNMQATSSIRSEVVAAIARLGYNNAHAHKIIDDVISQKPDISVSDAVIEVLKKM